MSKSLRAQDPREALQGVAVMLWLLLDLSDAWMHVTDEVNSLFLSPLESLMGDYPISLGEIYIGAAKELILVPVAFGSAEISNLQIYWGSWVSDRTIGYHRETTKETSSNALIIYWGILNELAIMLI